jgi:transcriptional antiterminator NusG
MEIRREGKKLFSVTAIFPGYIFAEIGESFYMSELQDYLRNTGEFFRVLPSNNDMRPLRGMDLEIITRFLTKSNAPLGISRVMLDEGQRIVVLDGPMQGLEGAIIKVDKRRKRAKIQLDMFNKTMTIDLGFELIESKDSKKES